MRLFIVSVLMLSGAAMLHAQAPVAGFTAHPGLTVEVGEEMLFDASSTTDDASLIDADFEWMFGDGYAFNHHYVKTALYPDDGIACTHFYMKPGTFLCTLKVTDAGGNIGTSIQTVTVTGEAAMDGFELLHARFSARTGQYLYVQIPAAVQSNATNRLRVTLAGDNGYNGTLADRTGLDTEEKVLLLNHTLTTGNYVLTVELQDAAGTRLSVIRQKFSKDYDGMPKVGIDENNAFRVDGELFFPVTSNILHQALIEEWSITRYVNTLMEHGWNADCRIETWQEYVATAGQHGMVTMGPGKESDMFELPGKPEMRNVTPAAMREVVDSIKNYGAVLTHNWIDEPELGGRYEYIPVEVLSAWTRICHLADPQHPVHVNLVGAEFFDYRGTQGGKPNYYPEFNADWFGGKRHCAWDVIQMDYYPYEFQWWPNESYQPRVMERWATAIDHMDEYFHNLVPKMNFIETIDIGDHNSPPTSVPSAEAIRMQTWLSVVHGCQGISWFNTSFNGGRTLPETYSFMTEFNDFLEPLTPVILGPEPAITVTDNANSRGNRVDCMVRTDSSGTGWIFAVRLTEIPETTAAPISVTFTVDSLNDEHRVVRPTEFSQSITEYHGDASRNNGVFTFQLAQVPVQPHTVLLAGRHEGGWTYLSDDGAGSIEDFGPGYKYRNTSGTVNYETGAVTVDFGEANYDRAWNDDPVFTGTPNVRACYRPVKDDIIVTHTGNSFTDSFGPNEVKIYRIEDLGVGIGNTAQPSQATGAAFTITPNPITSSFVIGGPAATVRNLPVTLYTTSGTPVANMIADGNRVTLGKTVPGGIYLLRIGADGPVRRVMIRN